MNKTIWFLQRASVMNPREVIHRVVEQIQIVVWKFRYKFGFRAFIQGTEKDFSFCVKTDKFLPDFSWKVVAQKQVQAILDNKIALFDGVVKFDREAHACWRTAPETNRLWPHTFFNSIDYREGNPYGDIRVAWEASRLQYLVTLAVYIKQNPRTDLTGRLVGIIRTDIISWHTTNPLMQGIHYVSSMECAIRLVVLTVTCDLVRDELRNDKECWNALTRIVLEHAYFIRRRLSLYSSTGNHTLAECAGLIFAGALFKEHDSANEWLDTGIALFSQEFDNQIDVYGVGKEQAIQYTKQILEFGLLVANLLTHKSITVPSILNDTLRRGIQDIRTIHHIVGTIPPIGDSDSGSAISPHFKGLWDYPVAPNEQSVYNNGSLALLRGRELMGDFVAVVNHGPLGMSPKYSHGHADALALTLYHNGHAVLVDTGTYSYTGAPEHRNYFRSTKAHNTATIDHLDQAIGKMLFMWSNPYSCNLLQLKSDDNTHIFVAKHDGYSSLGIDHIRHVIFHHYFGFVVVDEFAGDNGKEEHQYAIRWHIDSNVEKAHRHGYKLTDTNLDITFSDNVSPELISASDNFTCGWKSSSYYSREAINTLVLSVRSGLPLKVVTAFTAGNADTEENRNWWSAFLPTDTEH